MDLSLAYKPLRLARYIRSDGSALAYDHNAPRVGPIRGYAAQLGNLKARIDAHPNW